MNLLKLPTLALLLLFTVVLANPIAGQQKRQTPDKVPTKTPAAPAPPPTFDTLLAADSFKIYGEVRSVGQLIRSNNDVLEPVIKLADPLKEFDSFVKWLNANADELMTSRLLLAAWPNAKDMPDTVVAIEFASAEDAAKFEPKLNKFLPTILPPTPAENPAGEPKAAPPPKTGPPPKPEPPIPGYYLQRAGSLVVITPKPLDLKKLKPAGSKLLSQDPNFRTARNRLNSESTFLFIDVKAIQNEFEKERKQYDAESKKLAEQQEREREEASKKKEETGESEPPEQMTIQERVVEAEAQAQVNQPNEPPKEAPTPDPMSTALRMLAFSTYEGSSEWPDAIAVALSLENDSFDVRALLLSAPGQSIAPVPFIPVLVPGPAITPEAPAILPADTEMLVTMSLDFAQIHARMSKSSQSFRQQRTPEGIRIMEPVEAESIVTSIEKELKINIKDELLPLLGSEIAISLPVTGVNVVGEPQLAAPPQTKDNSTAPASARHSPVLAISLKDKEGVQRLLPKLLENAGLKGALALAQTERREDTELVSLANAFAYAYIGNFLIASTDAATVRHVVDSYLKHETLAGDSQFKNYTRWQPRQVQAQVYVSPALMESYKSLLDSPNVHLNDETKAFLFSRLSAVAQPVTYSLSNEGVGVLHELHVPKNLVVAAVTGLSSEANPPPMIQNERMAMAAMWMIVSAEAEYRSEKQQSGYVSIEQLIAEDKINKEMLNDHGYKFELTVTGNGFEISTVPVEYGKTGRQSFFMDQTHVLRAGDHAGAAATVADPPIH